MFPKTCRSVAFIALVIFLSVASAHAQTPAPAKAEPASAQDETVTEKAFRSKIIELKYVDPNSLQSVIRPLGSGFKGSTITLNRELKLIVVRDYPENIAVIEEAIKRLDKPEAPRPDIQFRVHILIATNNTQRPAGANDYPAELNDVIKQLQTTLSYKSYYMMSSQVIRSKEGLGGLGNKGVAEFKLSPETSGNQNPIFYQYRFDRVSLEAASTDMWKVQIGAFYFTMKIPVQVGPANVVQYEDIGFNTPVSMREGEKVVVGTTSMQDKGIVIVIVANVVK